MKKSRQLLVVFVSAIMITFLFHKQSLGINLLLFELLLFLWLIILKQFRFKNIHQVVFGLGFLITSLFTVANHSTFIYLINFLLALCLIGIVIHSEFKSILSVLGLGITNLFASQITFLKELAGSKLKGKYLGSHLWRIRIFLIPILIIVLFIILYKKSNPVFKELVVNINSFLYDHITHKLQDLDFTLLLTFALGLLISNFLFFRIKNKRIIDHDNNASENLNRKKRSRETTFRFNALKNEYRAGIFLLLILNLVILVLNVIDIKWVWLNFEWEGQYLKQFVHEGTYLLIISILISIALVLYYFRGNLNFYSKNRLLKILSYSWLVQNGILAVSVAIRNFWYIQYFALAYKRIGVIIFLILTLYGLYSVIVKVQKRKSAFYLIKLNGYAWIIVLTLSAFINWDIVIAKYNFRNAEHSFLHLNFMATLSDKALPWLDKSIPELKHISDSQKEIFPFERNYMSIEEYHSLIAKRKDDFINKWEDKKFLSWNLAEYRAYKKITRIKASDNNKSIVMQD